jgi:hypothetical protein
MKKRIAFISYRGDDYELAGESAEYLKRTGYFEDYRIFPPNSLCEQGEILLPYEFYELPGWVRDVLAICTHFYYLDTGSYFNSYFTQAELLQWQVYREDPIFYKIQKKVLRV